MTTFQKLPTGTTKAVPVPADTLSIQDSAAAFAFKDLTFASLLSFVQSGLSTVYQALLVSGSNIKTVNGNSLLGSGDVTIAAGGLVRDDWYDMTAQSAAYASATTFASTESSSSEATRLAGLSLRSLFTCTDTTGATRRIGWISAASAVGTTVTYTVVTNTDLASGDKNFRITPARKVEDYKHLISIPGQLVLDASNPQGVWLLNLKAASYLLPVSAAVRTAAAGTGAACAFNVYDNASNLFSAAPDLGTAATISNQRPTTNTIPAGDTVSLRITNAAGATNFPRDFQAELFIVPQALFTSQS